MANELKDIEDPFMQALEHTFGALKSILET